MPPSTSEDVHKSGGKMAAGGSGQTCQAKPQGEEIKLTSRGRNAKKVSIF